jgi:hypothetical protein
VPASALAYNRVTAHGDPPRDPSRYVIQEDSTFALQYLSDEVGLFEYTGRYSRENASIVFSFDANSGAWQATGTILGDSLFVAYNLDMQMSDFEDGVYVRIGEQIQ